MPEDLIRLLDEEAESKELDYKAPIEWKEKKEKCELVKDILAMANTRGGWIVIGVEENENGFRRVGLSPEQIGSFDTTDVNKFTNNYADPPVNTNLYKKADAEGRQYVFIAVPPFQDVPHLCVKEFPGVLNKFALYVRTNNNDSAPLDSAAGFRDLIELAVKNKSDQIISSIQGILKHGTSAIERNDEEKFNGVIEKTRKQFGEINPHEDKRYGYREVIIYPEHYAEDRFSLSTLREMAENACVNYTGWPLIFISRNRPDVTYNVADGIESVLTAENDIQYWRLYNSGLFFAKEIPVEDKWKRAKRESLILDFSWTCQYAAMAVDCAAKLFENNVQEDESLTLIFRITGLRGKKIDSLGDRRFFNDYLESRVDELVYKKKRTFIEWKTGAVEYALEISKYIFERFNWENPNLFECKQVMEKMLSRHPV